MNTQELIEYLSNRFRCDTGSFYLPYQQWISIYRAWESSNQSFIDGVVCGHLPLREPVAKLVYKKLCNQMPFDRDYVIRNYERTYRGLDFIVYPSVNPKRLVILLSGYSERKTYNRYSWYWDENESWNGDSVYLFMNDTENTWYCGHEVNKLSLYKDIILSVLSEFNLCASNSFVIGGSMGGYGAIRIGFEMNLGGVISINPQTSLSAAKLHNDGSWSERIEKCGNKFLSVTDVINGNRPTKLYLECGTYPADVFDLDGIILSSAKNNNILLLNPHQSTKHVTISPSKLQLDVILSVFESEVISIEHAKINAENASNIVV